jgi:serine/threonine-protein kinase
MVFCGRCGASLAAQAAPPARSPATGLLMGALVGVLVLAVVAVVGAVAWSVGRSSTAAKAPVIVTEAMERPVEARPAEAGMEPIGTYTAERAGRVSPPSPPAEGAAVTPVPDVRGLRLADAQTQLANVGLRGAVRDQMAHATIPEGCVIAQSPAASTDAAAGATVLVDLSTGALAEVPDVINMGYEAAVARIDSRGLVPVLKARRYSGSYAAGRISSQSPDAGTSVRRGETVYIVKSLGPQPQPRVWRHPPIDDGGDAAPPPPPKKRGRRCGEGDCSDCHNW